MAWTKRMIMAGLVFGGMGMTFGMVESQPTSRPNLTSRKEVPPTSRREVPSISRPTTRPSTGTRPATPLVTEASVITRLAFGSCAHQEKPQPIWESISKFYPNLFLLLGDNLYADTRDMGVMRAKYARFAANSAFQAFKKEVRILATWDDHDYGENDAGREYPHKEQSKQIFLDFFGEPANSPRRRREGVYEAYHFGPKGKRLQIILLDLRTFRTELKRRPMTREMELAHQGPYIANNDPSASMLGAAQWTWLEGVLSQPAEVRLIGSSIPFLSEGSGWETWDNMPKERQRMLDLLARKKIRNVVFVSGDTHWGEFSRLALSGRSELYEITSSGLTEVWGGVAPNQRRLGVPYLGENFGSVQIEWLPHPKIRLSLHKLDGAVASFREVSFPPTPQR